MGARGQRQRQYQHAYLLEPTFAPLSQAEVLERHLGSP
ncbi:hypothetical protein A176_001426 [Myxococcus hansupus]|uniref:Uncharacterized protein n=1 Tax=Pseudomyxococcus hansupus TaxID=1297742 RepID=A0A0H4WP29_9BACT|nr:hypothetical protein A176_001426 [Myxococcus hansupus]